FYQENQLVTKKKTQQDILLSLFVSKLLKTPVFRSDKDLKSTPLLIPLPNSGVFFLFYEQSVALLAIDERVQSTMSGKEILAIAHQHRRPEYWLDR
ncbi:MAG: hypothetical protein Q9M08_01155, partial [Mariprofundus sp.]|nr:hypothetical protein [Mariprofundus sp.]